MVLCPPTLHSPSYSSNCSPHSNQMIAFFHAHSSSPFIPQLAFIIPTISSQHKMFLARRCSALFCGCKVFVILLLHLFLLGADGEQQQKQQQNDRIEESCFEPRDLGVPCPMDGPGRSKKFYYNHQLGSCQPFIYKGCAGNFNRFETTTECRKACAKSSVKSQEWVLAERCNATHLVPDGHYIECAAGKCPEGHNCYPDSLCCPTKDFVCSLPDDSGTFAEGVPDKPRFAWSADIKSCWRFSYFGAKGNYNNFPTFHDCINFCGGKPN